jgi:hypothetical protein
MSTANTDNTLISPSKNPHLQEKFQQPKTQDKSAAKPDYDGRYHLHGLWHQEVKQFSHWTNPYDVRTIPRCCPVFQDQLAVGLSPTSRTSARATDSIASITFALQQNKR